LIFCSNLLIFQRVIWIGVDSYNTDRDNMLTSTIVIESYFKLT